MPRHPATAVGVTFMLAALSKLVVELPLGTMRLEQPALAGLIALTVWHRRTLALPRLRPLLPLIAAGLVYLATLAVSSAFVAADPAASLRLVAWTALSMAGGLAAALLLAGRAERAMAWFSGAGGVLAAFALLAGVGYVLFAVGLPWVDDAGTDMPRVAAFTLEPNLFASLLAALIPLGLERWRARPSLAALVIAAALLAAVGLGVTRAAYLGLGAGLIVYLGLLWLRATQRTRLTAVILIALVAGGAGLLMPKVLLDTRHSGLLVNRAGPIGNPPPANPNGGELQTFEYRLVRLRLGLADWQDSPLVGLGAYSFGQRHFDASHRPDVISAWPVLVLHDAGAIGLAGFLALLGLLGLRLWRTAGDSARGPTAAAFAGAASVLLVAYLATTALHFAVTWLILGGALATTLTSTQRDGDEQPPTAHSGFAWRLTAPLTQRSRRRRFEKFMALMAPRADEQLLDLGVTDATGRSSNFLESLYPWPERITAVAPAPSPAFTAAFPEVRYVVADGRALPFADGAFDVGFSNAVVEHVGTREQQRAFVSELTRTCDHVFLCTPNRAFPVDPHTLLPFVHWLPQRWRNGVLRATGNERWASEQTLNPLGARDLVALFPAGTNVRIVRQRVLGLTSVLIAIAQRQRT